MNIFEALRNADWKSISLSDIIEGCANEYLSDLNPLTSEEDKERFRRITLYRNRICATCFMNSDGWCDNTGNKKIVNVDNGQEVIGCGCNLKCHNALLKVGCPAGKWKAVA